ncbi:hypothetical protein [Nocardia sp. NPDC049707]|uniref:hypothetical protein n=1 Tax=Nocardia sp. NPDC049707 TaxID=3154735 RepID=UPI00341E0EB2
MSWIRIKAAPSPIVVNTDHIVTVHYANTGSGYTVTVVVDGGSPNAITGSTTYADADSAKEVVEQIALGVFWEV